MTRHCILYTVYSADFVFPIVSMSIQKQVPSLLGNTLPCHVVTCRYAVLSDSTPPSSYIDDTGDLFVDDTKHCSAVQLFLRA